MVLHEWLALSRVFFFLNIYRSGVLTALAWLVPHETAAVSAQVLCTPYNHAPCHFMQSHISKVYACLAVTCHLHFWQNDRDLLRATVVTWGWNGYRNKSQHRSWPWRRKFSSRSWRDSNPRPFSHESGALTTEPSPPQLCTLQCESCVVFSIKFLPLSFGCGWVEPGPNEVFKLSTPREHSFVFPLHRMPFTVTHALSL